MAIFLQGIHHAHVPSAVSVLQTKLSLLHLQATW